MICFFKLPPFSHHKNAWLVKEIHGVGESHWNILNQVPAVRFSEHFHPNRIKVEGLKIKKMLTYFSPTLYLHVGVKLLSPGHAFSSSMKIILVKLFLHSSAFSEACWWKRKTFGKDVSQSKSSPCIPPLTFTHEDPGLLVHHSRRPTADCLNKGGCKWWW